MVEDIFPGRSGGLDVSSGRDRPPLLHDDARGLLFFVADDGYHGPEVWALPVDGTARFRRGDVDGDRVWSMADAIAIIAFLFFGGDEPRCMQAADANASGRVNISDPIFLLRFLFLGGSAPAEPFPECGADRTTDALGCRASPGC